MDEIDNHSLHGYAGYVKTYILQTYKETCTVVDCKSRPLFSKYLIDTQTLRFTKRDQHFVNTT